VNQPQGERLAAFLKELSELSEKYGITIGGCGCCSSPFLFDFYPDERGGHYTADPDNLSWRKPTTKDSH